MNVVGAYTLAAASGIEATALRAERSAALRAAWHELPIREAEAIRLWACEDATYAEISRSFQIGYQAAIMLVARGLRKLRHPCRSRSFR